MFLTKIRAKTDPFVVISAALLFILVGVFILYPLLMTWKLSLTKAGAWSLDSYIYIFSKSWLRASLFHSIELGCCTATVGTFVGYVFAFLLTRTKIRAKAFFRFMATFPLISPPFMLALSVILLFGKNGLITHSLLHLDNISLYGFPGLLLVQTLGLFPLAYLTIQGILLGIESAVEDAALDLGASKWKTFVDITLPLSVPGIISAWLIVFVTSLADFANPMILGGRFDVLSVQAYQQFSNSENLSLGAALSNTLLIPCVIAYFIQNYYLKKKSYVTVTGKPLRSGRDLTNGFARFMLVSIAIFISGLVVLLYSSIFGGCFTKAWGFDYSFSLDNFKYLSEVGWPTVLNTVYFAVLATPVAAVLGLLIAYLVVRKKFWGRKFLDTLSLFPFALPGTAVGIGYVLAFNHGPLVLTGTLAIIVLSFIFRNMPVGIESAKASLLQIDKSIEEAAMNLGAGSFRVFSEITLPLIKPAIFASMAYVFVHCMTAVSAVIFLVSARWTHMTVLILDQTEILRLGIASVLCFVLIAIVLSAFWLIQKVVGFSPAAGGQG